jgi:polyphosphate kinase
LERLKFLAIFSSNLDEFFMIRVSGLHEAVWAGVTEPSPDGMTPADQLKEISERLRPMVETQMRCLKTDVLPKLADEGIVIRPYEELSKREKRTVNDYFLENVFPILTPQAVDPGHPFPYVSNLSLNLGLMVSSQRKKMDAPGPVKGPRFARIKLPPIVPKLVPVDDKGTSFTFLGSLIAANIEALFPHMKTSHCFLFRVTRDADHDIKEDEASDLLRTMQQHVRQLRFGDAARLEVAAGMPAEMVSYLTEAVELTKEDVYTVDGPLPDLVQLYDLTTRPQRSTTQLQLQLRSCERPTFDAIANVRTLSHHPTRLQHRHDFINSAAVDRTWRQ